MQKFKKLKKTSMGIFFIITAAFLVSCAGNTSTIDVIQSSESETNILKPSEEGFTFDYQLPKDWEAISYPEDNGIKMLDILMEMDTDNKEIPKNQYYMGAENALLYAEKPDSKFWDYINPDIPKELYEFPVNIWAQKNAFRLVSGKEFAQLNQQLIPYYVEAASRFLLVVDNIKKEAGEKALDDMLYYMQPGLEKENTYAYQYYTSFWADEDIIEDIGAFVTDNSLCYLSTDGTIRVRGMVLFENRYKTENVYGKAYTEIILGVVPQSAKTKKNDWKFGDFYITYMQDIIQMELIQKEEYQELTEKYQLKSGVPELPNWAGVYGN